MTKQKVTSSQDDAIVSVATLVSGNQVFAISTLAAKRAARFAAASF
jgi:hypothetical protein